jgi:hypothetical protein
VGQALSPANRQPDLAGESASPTSVVLDRNPETGKRFGLACAEAYHYIGPAPSKVEDDVRKDAVKP